MSRSIEHRLTSPHKRRRHQISSHATVRLLALLAALQNIAFSAASLVRAQSVADEYDDFVQQVLDEDVYGDPSASRDDFDDVVYQQFHDDNMQDKIRHEQQQQEADILHQQQQAEADRVAAQREADFARQLAKLEAAERQKVLQQKRRDGKIVRRVLQAAAHQDYYRVLGLRPPWVLWQVPAWQLPIPVVQWSLKIPGFTLGRRTVSSQQVKAAYRKRSKQTHPDKNQDGRAPEAFMAVEQAATVMSDDQLRAAHDAQRQHARQQRRFAQSQRIHHVLHTSWRATSRTTRAVRKVLGPFAVPVTILGALIV